MPVLKNRYFNRLRGITKLGHLQVNSAIHLEPCGTIICMKQAQPAGKHEGKNSVVAVLKPLATHTHKGECRFEKTRIFKNSLEADYVLFKGFGESCGEYSSAEIQTEGIFKRLNCSRIFVNLLANLALD